MYVHDIIGHNDNANAIDNHHGMGGLGLGGGGGGVLGTLSCMSIDDATLLMATTGSSSGNGIGGMMGGTASMLRVG